MDNRNLLLAVVLSGLLILGWDVGMRYFYPEAAISSQATPTDASTGESAAAAPAPAAAGNLGVEAAARKVDLKTALSGGNRVAIDTPRIAGSINLIGARIDDVVLKDYRESVKQDAGPVRLFAPEGTPGQYFAEFGFVSGGQRLPSSVVWTADGDRLTPTTPVTLSRTDANGVIYRVRFAVDEDYMITATQSVSNGGAGAAVVQPFALIKRTSTNATLDQYVSHSGPVGVFGGTLWDPHSYEELAELGGESPEGAPDWLGFTDQYWLGALVPGDGKGNVRVDDAGFRALGNNLFRTDLLYGAVTVPAGGSVTQETRLYAGAKDSQILDKYEDAGITYFGKAISWGWFEIVEKPILWLLRTLNGLVGNFGVAIILLTVIIRGLMFPIAQKQFASMAQMKAVQPKMKEIQERFKDDKQRQQQEIMKLYKDEKVNPLAGCLPMLIQIPIFFALYKVLVLAIEMRHEPFILWIRDLSVPDPAHILNLFGLLPFAIPEASFLAIGPLAVLLGITMWLTFKLNPAAMDPVQQQMFAIMPWILMFVMAPFAAGLLLYWVTSNVLTLAQQSYLYSKHPQLKAANATAEKAAKG
ncbi:membrane protein insertase YidC [Porphyrobacter sp. CACIAM 03H1]|uniref:membrane protein insertase YidC n=1 Tax=Porphyrobacter sp. CACIAM 03H1 TaxID=2003315 RepID=UPI000B5A9281|nr:membrane protein insertase YidC [Porphyrobacter sp. CACIAM 03H1]ASJ92339.1 membrane protein insertase YidC [Porphyrobacter sp. CACIAM 03H1]